jgi:hypothetical protein
MKLRLNIAANAAGITLGQYIDYQNAFDAVERVRVITGKSSESIKLLQMHVLDEIIMQFEGAVGLSQDNFERKIKAAGTELGFIPDLSAMTFAEYVDLDTHCGKLYSNNKLQGETLAKVFAILYRPIKAKMGKYYDIEEYDSDKKSRYMDSIKALNMQQVLSALLFFSSLEAELLNSSLEYLAKEITEIMTEATKPAHQTA